MRKILENTSTYTLRAMAHSYRISGADEMDREKLIEEIYALSIKTMPVDKDGNPLKLNR